MRHLILLLPLALAACDDKPAGPDAPAPKGGAKAAETTRQPTRAVTGVAILQRDHAEYIEMIEKEEKKKTSDKATVKQVLKLLDVLEVALKRSVKEQAEQDLKKAHTRGQVELGRISKRRLSRQREKAEVMQILADAAKGTAPIPSGFTEAELQDKRADIEESLRELKKVEDKLLTKMEKQEAQLNSGKEIPPQEGGMASRELKTLQETRKRAEALLKR